MESLPVEIMRLVLEGLVRSEGSLASLAAASRTWQSVIEPLNFSRIALTPGRLLQLNAMTRRNRLHVRYLWLSIDLDEYDCGLCTADNHDFGETDRLRIMSTIERIFICLGTWDEDEHQSRGLTLDLGVYSPSDSKHWFKYLTWGSDLPDTRDGLTTATWPDYVTNAPYHRDATDRHRPNVDDGVDLQGSRDSFIRDSGYDPSVFSSQSPRARAIDRIFSYLDLYPKTNDDEDEADEFWRTLPTAPAVTNLLLRQQTRRQWPPGFLIRLLSQLPGLRAMHYEQSRLWANISQTFHDSACCELFYTLFLRRSIKSLVLFENFNEAYPAAFDPQSDKDWRCPVRRSHNHRISWCVASVAPLLQRLSASFMADAAEFFNFCLAPDEQHPVSLPGLCRPPSVPDSNLVHLTLTSAHLVPRRVRGDAKLEYLFLSAASVAAMMPKLMILEIWNGRRALAGLFRYRRYHTKRVPHGRGPAAVISWKGTWELDSSLSPHILDAWNDTAREHCGIQQSSGPIIDFTHDYDEKAVINCLADAISFLGLDGQVIRPVSLKQIRREHEMREAN